MFLYRITTGGLMYNYKTHLQGSYKKLADAMEKVETERNFNSYAEDPAAASKAFQLRRVRATTAMFTALSARHMTRLTRLRISWAIFWLMTVRWLA